MKILSSLLVILLLPALAFADYNVQRDSTLLVTTPNLKFAQAATSLADDKYTGSVITGYNSATAITQWALVYLTSGGVWALADNDGASTYPVQGWATNAAGAGGVAMIVLVNGVFRDDGGTSWTVGSPLYLSGSAGVPASTPPTSTSAVLQVVGTALSAHVVLVSMDASAASLAIPTVPSGGTGAVNFTAYAPVVGGTTSTGALQSAGAGTIGQVYTSNGAAAVGTFQGIPHAITFSITGGGSALATGVQDIIVNAGYTGTLIGWTATTSPADTITFDVLRSADAGAAPSTSIVGGGGTKPNVSSGVNKHSTSFTSWTSTAITQFDNLKVQITAVGGTATPQP